MFVSNKKKNKKTKKLMIKLKKIREVTCKSFYILALLIHEDVLTRKRSLSRHVLA